ncbi:MAG: preprotein translocase subunit SecG [Anaerolineae bacterium]|nr:preprotein translocase subunit SecG [Anaerolineae bacterium]MDW8071203.1 preprotein translocase subunit SecG [Anaerolineae bacterium]
MSLHAYVNLIEIIIAGGLIALILLQTKSTSLGSVFGGDSAIHRTRRGVEKTLHQATIVLSAIFFLVAVLNVIISV